MYRLARIRVAGAGPIDARFDKPSPEAGPFEVSCIGASDAPEDSVIWLENGGGKTVFLALLFHVLRPDKASQIGNDEKGRRADIGDFVLTGDVAHVACEWAATDGDARLITGLVADRRGTNINRTWYLLAVRDRAASLEDLVFDIDGRRVPHSRFLESLDQLASRAGKTGRHNRIVVTKATTQRHWFDVLADHDLDPALFEYQVRMNRSEGGATSLFRFSSAEKFVDFFLQLTLNADTVAALTEELGRVADKVSSLPRKELELAHSAGAVERVGRLTRDWAEFRAADAARRTAVQQAEHLYDRLAAAVSAAEVGLAQADARITEAEGALSDANRDRRENETRTRIVAIELGDARVTELERQVETVKAATADSTLTADAWPRVPQLVRIRALDGEIRETEAALAVADADAAPLRERRDQLLRGLRDVLNRGRALAENSRSIAESERIEAAGAAVAADERQRAEDGAARQLDGRISELERQRSRYEDKLRAAIADGVLPVGTTPADALAAAEAAVGAAEQEIARIERERIELTNELEPARRRRDDTTADLNRVANEHERQRTTVESAQAERAALAAHPLLGELGGTDVDLELIGAELAVRAGDEAERLRAEAITASAVAAEDQRAAEVLERDRLLPARADVESLCRKLLDDGVSNAVPGWRYLVDAIPVSSHADAIAAHPALADGIVVPAAEVERARSLLADESPSAAIVIGAGGAFDDTTRSSDGLVIPPAAALHERGAAEAELERRRTRLEAADDEAARISAQERTARELAAALTAHIEAWPPGRLPAALARLDELAAAAADARTQAEEAASAVVTLEGWLQENDEQVREARARATTEHKRASRLDTLAVDADAAAETDSLLTQLRTDRTSHHAAAEAAAAERATATAGAEAALGRRATAEHAVAAADRQLAQLPEPEDGPSAEGELAELHSAYETAARLVVEATTDSELARRLVTIREERSSVAQELAALPAGLQERISILADRPEATDATARRHADAEARRLASEAAERLAELAGRCSAARAERSKLPDPEPSWKVEPFDIPMTIEELEAFLAVLEAEGERTRAARAAADEQLAAAREARVDVGQHRDALAGQLSALAHGVANHLPAVAEVFTGDAVVAVASALAAINEARSRRERADAAWRSAAGALNRWARDEKWKNLTGELARRLRDDDPDVLAPDAEHILTQTKILEARLREDIAGMDVHRQMLVTSLGDAVSEAARSLRTARRKSELPPGLGDWSHQPFLKLGCEIARDRTELDARLRRFTNDLLERAPVAGLPTGSDLVCRALLACTEREVTVEVLKPNKAQRLRYVPIDEIATLSGGMRATAAIAMFCTLAKVRAANRSGRVGVGTLVLDNPLGDANATYLVALQRLMAQTSDVQLVYTTGVNDMDALRMFPVVTRLTNEAAKRSHLAYVVADEAFLKRLAPADGDHAIVTGTRLVRRTQPLLAVDLAKLDGDDE